MAWETYRQTALKVHVTSAGKMLWGHWFRRFWASLHLPFPNTGPTRQPHSQRVFLTHDYFIKVVCRSPQKSVFWTHYVFFMKKFLKRKLYKKKINIRTLRMGYARAYYLLKKYLKAWLNPLTVTENRKPQQCAQVETVRFGPRSFEMTQPELKMNFNSSLQYCLWSHDNIIHYNELEAPRLSEQKCYSFCDLIRQFT